MPTSSWHTYILQCKDGSLYTGSTNDLSRRVIQHNNGTGAKYTRIHRPVKLVYSEEYADQSAACKREAQIKKMKREQKKKIISG